MTLELKSILKKALLFSILGYAINTTTLFFLPSTIVKSYQYWSVEGLFFIFSILTMVLLTILVAVMKKNFDQIGMVFLILTSVKMVAAFFIGKSIIYAPENQLEKINFYGIFAYFLLLETILTSYLLNKKV